MHPFIAGHGLNVEVDPAVIVAAHAFHAAETLGSILPRLPRLWWRPCRHQRRPSHRTCLGTPTYAMVAMPAVLASFSLLRIATSLRPVFPEFGLRCVSDRLRIDRWRSHKGTRSPQSPTLKWVAGGVWDEFQKRVTALAPGMIDDAHVATGMHCWPTSQRVLSHRYLQP